jgi:UDP-GlcNAc:undecaprenyl-phosphate GlcNAc-1-phosphate transferase
MTLLLLCGLTLLLSATMVYLIIKAAHRFSWYDHIDERKVHTGQIPRLGGVAFIPAYLIVIIILTLTGIWKEQVTSSFVLVLAAMVFIVVFGIWDDFKPLRARYKALVQFVAAILVVAAGYRFTALGLPWGATQLNLGLWLYTLGHLDCRNHQCPEPDRWHRWASWGAFCDYFGFLCPYLQLLWGHPGGNPLPAPCGGYWGLSDIQRPLPPG